MTELAEWLLARIAEDEADARAAYPGPWTIDGDLTSGPARQQVVDWIYDDNGPHIARWDPARVLAECEAKRRIVALETADAHIPEWTPDCGGDWCLTVGALSHEPGIGAFANYWPDNTVSASVYIDGECAAESGIVARASRAECQAFAEQWVREHLPLASSTLRLLALPYADHPDYRQEWRP